MGLERRRFLHLTTAAAAFSALPRIASAQSYPDRPVRVVVPFAPGGPTDVVTRFIASKLADRTGKQFFVENVGGGGGNIAMGRVSKMAPDGYTLLMVNPSYVVNPTLSRDVPYRFEKDFDPVSLGLDLVHVPYNSAGEAVGSTVGGHTQICFASPSPAAQQVVEGRLRGLAVTSKQRSQTLPDVPTTAEAGYPGVAGDNWQGIIVPAGTPKEIIAYLHREIVEAVKQPEIRERLGVLGFEPVAGTPDEFAQHAKSEFEKWAKVIKDSGIKAE